MIFSICIKCGAAKRAPYHRCKKCGFDPSYDDLSLAQSVALSEGPRDEFGKPLRAKSELMEISHHIANGEPYNFDSKEIHALLAQKATVDEGPSLIFFLCYLLGNFGVPVVWFFIAWLMLFWLIRFTKL